ncbi:MAG: ATP-binding cassette domain-containing protein [Gammaproteobacteria bacterium]|nr:ATP-binding cassette domain-containing protein [Gammaproteobacteria bacterium]
MASELKHGEALASFFAAHGKAIDSTANRPIQLNDADAIWMVERGTIDVLAAEFDAGRITSPLRHVMRLGPGQLAFGTTQDEHLPKLIVKGLEGTRLRLFRRDSFLAAIRQSSHSELLLDELIALTDSWIEDFAASVAHEMEAHPQVEYRLSSGCKLKSGIASALTGVRWIISDDLDSTFLDLAETRGDMIPVTVDSWIRIHATEGLSCLSTKDLGIVKLLHQALPEFHRLVLSAESLNRRLLLADEANMQVAQAFQRRRAKTQARTSLQALVGKPQHADGDGKSPLEKALAIIARNTGLEFQIPDTGNNEPTIRDFCKASGLRMRRIRLVTEDRWWLGDSGIMLAFSKADSQPVVLLPNPWGNYRIMDPTTGKSVPANASHTQQLKDACLLYPRLSAEGVAGLGGLFRTARCKMLTDFILLVVMGLGTGFLSLAPVVAVNWLIGRVIPDGNTTSLLQLSAFLTGIAFLSALFYVLRGTALMRMEGRLTARLTALVWDRLLRLRPDFFRRYSAGELATCSMVFQDIRDHVSGVTADGILSCMFLLPALGLLFIYDLGLGIAVACFGVLAIFVTVLFGILHVEPQYRYLKTSRELAGILHQYLSGISKLRITGAEDSAFATWALKYKEQKQAEIKLSALSAHVSAFSAATPALASAILFAAVFWQDGRFEVADFIAIHTAAMVFSMSLMTLSNSVRAIAFIVPACRQVEPILSSPAEVNSLRGSQSHLSGEVLLDQVSFNYPELGEKVLDNVTIHARPNEFVAIVGESGAGKSTILRLALGLERPLSGAVYYGERDLAQLDLGTVRAQIGVVMQDDLLQHGNILEAIIGVDDGLTTDDAWRAAAMAGVDKDIRAMPMGMYTTIGENLSTFSGGQIQRIKIAAALVRNPRIVFLDEPTSWLDNQSQAQTMQGIENSVCTRIVVAHRLSTVRMANRIYVLNQGKVVQTGTFYELFEVDGPFRNLALRQIES